MDRLRRRPGDLQAAKRLGRIFSCDPVFVQAEAITDDASAPGIKRPWPWQLSTRAGHDYELSGSPAFGEFAERDRGQVDPLADARLELELKYSERVALVVVCSVLPPRLEE
jgi:hypothetical protein